MELDFFKRIVEKESSDDYLGKVLFLKSEEFLKLF